MTMEEFIDFDPEKNDVFEKLIKLLDNDDKTKKLFEYINKIDDALRAKLVIYANNKQDYDMLREIIESETASEFMIKHINTLDARIIDDNVDKHGVPEIQLFEIKRVI